MASGPSVTKKKETMLPKGKVFKFYGDILEVARGMVNDLDDKSNALEKISSLKVTKGTEDQDFFSKTKGLTELLQNLASHKKVPPPTAPKPSKRKSDTLPNHLSKTQLNLDIGSTVMASKYRTFDVQSGSKAEEEHGDGTGSAIPLCLPNNTSWDPRLKKCIKLEDSDRSSLVLNQQALNILESISGPVCILSIVGPCRTGKSYILSRLISSTGKSHFDLGHEMDPKTMGIWMWDRPFKIKLSSGMEATLVLLDTEGIDATNASEQGDNQIFTLSVLISSLLIYNSMTLPRRDDLTKMHFIANLSKSIQIQTGQLANSSSPLKLVECNPHFMWILRDVILQPTDRMNKPCHVKDYLLQKVLAEDHAGDETQRKITQCLLGFFSSFDAESLPPPSTDAHVMNNIDNPLYEKDISALFLNQVEYVRKRILNNCTPKRGFTAGSLIDGHKLSKLIVQYIESLNSGCVPAVGSAWQRVLESTYTESVEKAVHLYSSVMSKVSLPLESAELLKNHNGALAEGIGLFQARASLDSESELYQSYLDKLMTRIAEYSADGQCKGGVLYVYLQDNLSRSKAACHTLLQSLKQKYLDPLIEVLGPSSNFSDITMAFNTILTHFDASDIARGPAAEEVIESFIENIEKDRKRLEKQLKTIKAYDEDAQKRIYELKDKERTIKQKENELRLGIQQAQNDHDAKLAAMRTKFERDSKQLKEQVDKAAIEFEKRYANMTAAKVNELKSIHHAELEETRRQLNATITQLNTKTTQLQQQITKYRTLPPPPPPPPQPRGGCFIAGTKVTRSDGSQLCIEKQVAGLKLLALGGEITTITEEYVEHDHNAGAILFGINEDTPFSTLHHPFWTTEGWKSLHPEMSKSENPHMDFGLLQIGDIVFCIAQAVPLLYKPVKVSKFFFATLSKSIKIYGLHLDGPRSYHANGYIVAANYPVLTKKRVFDGMKKLSEEERDKVKGALSSVKHELSEVLGEWASHAFEDMDLVEKNIQHY